MVVRVWDLVKTLRCAMHRTAQVGYRLLNSFRNSFFCFRRNCRFILVCTFSVCKLIVWSVWRINYKLTKVNMINTDNKIIQSNFFYLCQISSLGISGSNILSEGYYIVHKSMSSMFKFHGMSSYVFARWSLYLKPNGPLSFMKCIPLSLC